MRNQSASNLTNLFFSRTVTSNTHLYLSQNLKITSTQPNFGFEIYSSTLPGRALSVSKEMVNDPALIPLLNKYFASLSKARNRKAYTANLHRVFTVLQSTWANFCLGVAKYRDTRSHISASASQSHEYQILAKSLSNSAWDDGFLIKVNFCISTLTRDRLEEVFCSFSASELQKITDNMAYTLVDLRNLSPLDQNLERFRKNITALHETCLDSRSNPDAIVSEMKLFAQQNPISMEADSEMRKYFSTALQPLIANPSIAPLLELALRDRDLRIIVPAGSGIASDFREQEELRPTVWPAAALCDTETKTIYLPYDPQYGFPFPKPTYWGINGIRLPANLLGVHPFSQTIFDEFMHFVMFLIFKLKNNLPFRTPEQKKAYVDAINNDKKHIQSLMKKLTNAAADLLEPALLSMMSKISQYFNETKTAPMLLALIGDLEIMKSLRAVQPTQKFILNSHPQLPKGTYQLLRRLPDSSFFGSLILLGQDATTENPNFFVLLEELVNDVNQGMSASHSKKYEQTDKILPEIINRLPFQKWGKLVALVAPGLYRYYRQHVLPAVQSMLRLKKEPEGNNVAPEAKSVVHDYSYYVNDNGSQNALTLSSQPAPSKNYFPEYRYTFDTWGNPVATITLRNIGYEEVGQAHFFTHSFPCTYPDGSNNVISKTGAFATDSELSEYFSATEVSMICRSEIPLHRKIISAATQGAKLGLLKGASDVSEHCFTKIGVSKLHSKILSQIFFWTLYVYYTSPNIPELAQLACIGIASQFLSQLFKEKAKKIKHHPFFYRSCGAIATTIENASTLYMCWSNGVMTTGVGLFATLITSKLITTGGKFIVDKTLSTENRNFVCNTRLLLQ